MLARLVNHPPWKEFEGIASSDCTETYSVVFDASIYRPLAAALSDIKIIVAFRDAAPLSVSSVRN